MTRNLAKSVALECQQPVHVSNVSKIVSPTGIGAYGVFPEVDEFENTRHDRTREGRRALWETTDKFVEEFLGGDLEMEGVAA